MSKFISFTTVDDKEVILNADSIESITHHRGSTAINFLFKNGEYSIPFYFDNEEIIHYYMGQFSKQLG